MRIEVNFQPLEFFVHNGYVYYMLDIFKNNLYVQELEYEIPYIDIQALTLGKNGIIVGYKIRVPKKHKLLKSVLQVGSDFTDTHLHSGILGLQVFESAKGVTLISSKRTSFFEKINKPM